MTTITLKPNKTRAKIFAAIVKNPNVDLPALVKLSGAASKSVVTFHIDRLIKAGILSKGPKYIVLRKQ